ncbi:hypothetical protein [Pseudoalteromonas luteoviolacea]|uniref:Polysaccharide deacetylase n=1 Tax=Pseudoalteromonas luteoviolacea S4054 TaxID=1129367 RepID=A0A0F6ACU3_9GAMM|nr:hypothetical protein [Pseudoalteromonas luteoviolacea]AOT09700.1 hypothetical protein S4054249_18560 [Pseudoalteromonas luteoviolacea]AOT14613.1 hypothetical protein S40542_18530 [Pseudoalteromonas luteoviolacea]AOT19527.1 hypothetical protein S4054_18535 [Pseudoalteromonas luteoviolacea]KKE83968.1 hypothetical protein N479_11185 [Pseudoalteromonas luteoviolacea S4054]KZN77362.1 hypothetical protein N481_04725 [Pseudoalteromonas luteoviolacea S4047-1]
MDSAQDFSENRLRKLYRKTLENGFSPIFYGEEDHSDKFILWRHDIDIELPAVRRMAKIEAEEGIKSTYFLMFNSVFYNLLTEEGKQTVELLKSLNHKVALHCDLGVPRDAEVSDEFVEEKVHQDLLVLESFFGKGVFESEVSFHNPPNAVLNKSYKSFYSTYQEKFFGEIKYLSDSNRVWRDGCPELWLEKEERNKYSILLHPVIWAYEGATMPEMVTSYLKTESERRLKHLENDGIIV